jgi:hypothetical protein
MRSGGTRLGVMVFIAAAATAATVALVSAFPSARDVVSSHALELAVLFCVTVLLQTSSIRVPGRGSLSASSIGILACAFALGAGAAVFVAVAAAVTQWVRRRGILHRAVFDAANFSLSAGAGGAVFALFAGEGSLQPELVVAAAVAGTAYCALNTGLLCVAMGLSERTSPLAVWRERFSWATPHYLLAGPLAFASVLAYQHVGLVGFAVFGIPHAIALFAHRRLALAPG